ncbi:hypothetical protein EV659_11335 [Rhodothalassium salexigens DSM 2132]|uniref:Uncharacterized protein n=1 Tax=Rhodothalassium salexigens DSM 2132 TaxID=1188247 RepID=A0A4R2P7B7_RHOSA|nr:hypothetical protein [Rhodothalassium salexigens DSM 2132]TCP30782.1 hypothetical protein EV659_11335 [Rhodothalassium salexigens DSM 2132]
MSQHSHRRKHRKPQGGERRLLLVLGLAALLILILFASGF